jgi:hypothetical protein
MMTGAVICCTPVSILTSSAAEGFGIMRWLDPMPTACPVCGGRFPVPVAALRSLRAACPGCGASLAAAGERMLAEEARVNRQVGLIAVAFELGEQTGLDILDSSEFDAAGSLTDLVRIVAGRLPPSADREARAAELVVETARRVAPLQLSEAGEDERIARLRLADSKHAEPGSVLSRGDS